MWLRDQHTVEAYAGARLRLSSFRPPRRLEPSGAVPTETRAERVQALVSEARVTAHAVADDPRLTLLLRNALASLYREGSGLSTTRSVSRPHAELTDCTVIPCQNPKTGIPLHSSLPFGSVVARTVSPLKSTYVCEG